MYLLHVYITTKWTISVEQNHKLTTTTCFTTPVPFSGGVLSHVNFKSEQQIEFSYSYVVVTKCT